MISILEEKKLPPGPPPWLFQSLSYLTSLFINLLIYKTKNLFAFSYLVKLATLKHGRQLALHDAPALFIGNVLTDM